MTQSEHKAAGMQELSKSHLRNKETIRRGWVLRSLWLRSRGRLGHSHMRYMVFMYEYHQINSMTYLYISFSLSLY